MPTRRRNASIAILTAAILAVVLTRPLAAKLGSAGRLASGDGRHGVWNVAWVAHALTTNPATLFDTNIFYPHTNTLAYSEANLVAGMVAIPVWLATANPYAAFNTVVLLAFAAAALSAFLLVRVLGGSRLGASVAGLTYGFSPYMFSHLAHIQLLMTFGPALSMAALHHFTNAPSSRRGALLGGSLALTALSCAYHGIFAGLMTGFGLGWSLISGKRFGERQYWLGVLVAVAIGALIVGPIFVPYLSVRDAGFERSLDEARLFSSTVRDYLVSAGLLHRWMLPWLEQWHEVLFPGFLATALSTMSLITLRQFPLRDRRTVVFYGVLGVVAFWSSLGPDAGLYTVLYTMVPAFDFLRAPARFGVIVLLSVSVVSGLALTWLQSRLPRSGARLAVPIILVAVLESSVGPLVLTDAPMVSPVYRQLAAAPRAPVAEFPFYRGAAERSRQTEYMLMSTFHWQPLVNGYSDHLPPGYYDEAVALATFPSEDAWQVIRDKQVRWVVVHFNRYPDDVSRTLRPALRAMSDRLRLAVDDPTASLYEVIWPTPQTFAPRR